MIVAAAMMNAIVVVQLVVLELLHPIVDCHLACARELACRPGAYSAG